LYYASRWQETVLSLVTPDPAREDVGSPGNRIAETPAGRPQFMTGNDGLRAQPLCRITDMHGLL
jgi:hypothetical protein